MASGLVAQRSLLCLHSLGSVSGEVDALVLARASYRGLADGLFAMLVIMKAGRGAALDIQPPRSDRARRLRGWRPKRRHPWEMRQATLQLRACCNGGGSWNHEGLAGLQKEHLFAPSHSVPRHRISHGVSGWQRIRRPQKACRENRGTVSRACVDRTCGDDIVLRRGLQFVFAGQIYSVARAEVRTNIHTS